MPASWVGVCTADEPVMDYPIGEVCGAVRECLRVQAERVRVLRRGDDLGMRMEPIIDPCPGHQSASWAGDTWRWSRRTHVSQASSSGMRSLAAMSWPPRLELVGGAERSQAWMRCQGREPL